MTKKRYFVDKTRYIEKFSSFAKDYLYFVRPRRFGKSLFLSMLGTYFDVSMKDSFDLYFKDAWIHTHPTDDQGAYQVIRLDFSKVSGDISCAESDFNQSVGLEILLCARKYQKFYDQDFLDRLSGVGTAKNRLDYYCPEAALRGYQLYLLVDEYDNFTNTILSGNGRDRYDEITHSDGFLRSFFKVVKTGFDRIFLTGISPMTLNDITSGFNIATNLSHNPLYNDMLGFSTADVRKMVEYYQENGFLQGQSPDEIIDTMAPWYDGYCFSHSAWQSSSRVFNSYMVTSYLNA